MAEASAFQMKGFEEIMAALDLFIERSIDLRPALNEVTQLFSLIEADRFKNSGSSILGGIPNEWQPLSEWRLREKLGPKNKILVDTGAMAHAAMFPKVIMTKDTLDVIVDTSKVPYAEDHQTGDPSRNLPQREWLTITELFMLESQLIMLNYLYSDNPAQRTAENNYAKRLKQERSNSRVRKFRDKRSRPVKEAKVAENKAAREKAARHKKEAAQQSAQKASRKWSEERKTAAAEKRYAERRGNTPLTPDQYFSALSNRMKRAYPELRLNAHETIRGFHGAAQAEQMLKHGLVSPGKQYEEAFRSKSGLDLPSRDIKQFVDFARRYPEQIIRHRVAAYPDLYGRPSLK